MKSETQLLNFRSSGGKLKMAILIYKKKTSAISTAHHLLQGTDSRRNGTKIGPSLLPTPFPDRLKVNDFIYSLWPYKRPEKDEQRGAKKKDRNEEKKRNREHRGRLEKQTRQKQGKRTKSQRTPASPCSSEHKHSRQTKTERLEHKNKRPETEDGRAEKLEEKTRKKQKRERKTQEINT
jgi:hypothetical protein